jgi:hypothetical protein
MTAGLPGNGIEHFDNFTDDSPVYAAGDTLAATMQKCSAYIRSDREDANCARPNRASELESDGVGQDQRNPSGSKGSDGPEKGEERQMVQFDGDEQHTEDQPGNDDHRESPTAGCSVGTSVVILPVSMFTTALPIRR